MDWSRVLRLVARVTYTITALYVGFTAAREIEEFIIAAGREELTIYLRLLLALVIISALVVRLAWMIMSVTLAWGILSGDPLSYAYLVLLAILASISSIPLRGIRGWYRESAKRLPLTILSPFTIYLLAMAPLAAAGYRLTLFLEEPPALPGELGTVNSLLYPTLLYRVIIGGLFLGVAYKSVSALADLLAVAAASPRMARAMLEYEVADESKPVLGFQGKQYPFLEWGVVAFMSLLAAPLVYRPLTDVLVTLAGESLPGVYAALLSLGVTLLASWIFLRFIVIPLARQASLSYILEPRPALPIVTGLILIVGLAMIIVIAGGDPLQVLEEVVTGRPIGEDPLGGVLDYSPPEDYYRSLAELIDLFARLLWGG